MAVERAAPTPQTTDAEAHAVRRRLFTVDEYYKMAEAGILGPDERVELIEGVVVRMPPIGPRHAFNVDRLYQLFLSRVGNRALARSQNPLHLAPGAEPEPDIALVRIDPGHPKAFEARHPNANEALLVVEVADTSAAFDLGEKAIMYAGHAVSELWVLDLAEDRLVVHREPTPDGYASVEVVGRGETVRALAFPDIAFSTDEILG